MLLYVFKTYIRFGVQALFIEHYLSALFIGAWRVECAIFGCLEPSLVPCLVSCLTWIACVHVVIYLSQNLAKAKRLGP